MRRRKAAAADWLTSAKRVANSDLLTQPSPSRTGRSRLSRSVDARGFRMPRLRVAYPVAHGFVLGGPRQRVRVCVASAYFRQPLNGQQQIEWFPCDEQVRFDSTPAPLGVRGLGDQFHMRDVRHHKHIGRQDAASPHPGSLTSSCVYAWFTRQCVSRQRSASSRPPRG